MTLLEWLATFPVFDQDTAFLADTEVGFWPDQGPAKIRRFRDRVFVGDAADCTGNRAMPQGAWLPDDTAGPAWMIRDSQMAVMASTGLIAITGAARSSDQVDLPNACIGVEGFVLNDKPNGKAWALYADIQHEDGANWSAGLEVAAKNKGENWTDTPYSISARGVFGAWLAGGGGLEYGGAPTNPSNAAIVVLKNDHTWNRGMVFGKDALTGNDGVTGYAIAIHMPKGDIIRWDAPNGKGADIVSDVTDTAKRVKSVYANDTIYYLGANDQKIVAYQHAANGVNALVMSNAAAGGAPTIAANGPAADIPLALTPKGGGHVRFGAFTPASGTVEISGWIEVEDAAGNVRRLAVLQ